MGRFSIEPPRRNLLVHHTFNAVENDRVIDYSPQANDGKIVGDVTFGYGGTVGQAARMQNESDNVAINELADFFPRDGMQVSAWGRSERAVPSSETNVQVDVTVGGSTTTIHHTVSEDVSGWQFACATYDGTRLRLWYARRDEPRPTNVESVSIGGEVESFNLTFNTVGYGFVDDVRLYGRRLDEGYIEDIFDIGAEHQSAAVAGDSWDNAGIPYRGSNKALAGAVGEEKDYVRRQLDALLEARHINEAAGRQLDRLGGWAGIRRKDGEDDAKYRARIKARLATARSRGTFSDVLDAAAAVASTEPSRIELTTDFSADPATVTINIRTADIEAAELTQSEITSILKDVVPGGHDIEVVSVGATPFTVRNDTMTNDSANGLTSDSISTGGGLVEDA